MDLLQEIPYAVLIAGMVTLGLYLANYFYDKGIVHWMSRKVGHLAAGVAYLLAVLLFSAWIWPVILSGGFTALLLIARITKAGAFRGVGGSAREQVLAECWLPGAGTVSLLVGWTWLGDRWLALLPILFACWGDAITGIIRSQIYATETKGNCGTLGMIAACSLIAWCFMNPVYAGAIGAGVATLVERFTPLSEGLVDDNWTVPMASLATLIIAGAFL